MATAYSAATVQEAWERYLDDTRNVIGYRYDEIEPWAWERLKASLKDLAKNPPTTKLV